MERLRIVFASLLAAVAMVTGCELLEGVPAELKVGQTEVEFVTSAAASKTVTFTASVAWTAEVTEGEDWILLDKTSGDGSEDEQKVTVSVRENPEETAREGKIVISVEGLAGHEVTVRQAAKVADVPAPAPDELSSWSIVGTLNNWGEPAEEGGAAMPDVAMYVSGDYFVAKGVALTVADEIKFRKDGAWDVNRGAANYDPVTPDTVCDAVDSGPNIKVKVDGVYDIYLTASLDKFYVMTEGRIPAEAVEPEVPVEDSWGLVGVNGDWMTNVPLALEDGWYVAKGLEFTDNVYFKIWANQSWSVDEKNIGFAPEQVEVGAALNTAVPVHTKASIIAAGTGTDSGNIWFTDGVPGVYDVYFSLTEMTLYVMTAGYRPGDDVPVAPALPEFEAGEYWIVAAVADTCVVGRPISGNYGYMQVDDAVIDGELIRSTASNAFTFAPVEGGYTIRDSNGKYLYMSGTYNSFNVSEDLPSEGHVWAVGDVDGDGLWDVTNVMTSKFIQYTRNYVSFGAYDTALELGVVAMLVKAENPVDEPEVPEGVIDATAAEVIDGVNDARYRLTGYVSSVVNTKYGNFYVKDHTGEVYIYGTLDASGKTANFASLGIKEGDIVTVTGPRTVYGTKVELLDVTVEAHYPVKDVTVSEFLAAPEDDTWYRVCGTISNVKNTLYGNFDLVDETGSVYVYGLLTGWGGAKKQYESLGLSEGDVLTLVGQRTSYNGTPQVGGAFYVSHEILTR